MSFYAMLFKNSDIKVKASLLGC